MVYWLKIKTYLNCDCSWGSAPDPTGEAYSAPPDTLAGFKGQGEDGGRERRARSEKGARKDGEEREG